MFTITYITLFQFCSVWDTMAYNFINRPEKKTLPSSLAHWSESTVQVTRNMTLGNYNSSTVKDSNSFPHMPNLKKKTYINANLLPWCSNCTTSCTILSISSVVTPGLITVAATSTTSLPSCTYISHQLKWTFKPTLSYHAYLTSYSHFVYVSWFKLLNMASSFSSSFACGYTIISIIWARNSFRYYSSCRL